MTQLSHQQSGCPRARNRRGNSAVRGVTRITMAAFCALAFVTPLTAVDAQRGTYSSRSHGPTFGVSLAGVSLSLEGADRGDVSGSGVQMEVGWHLMSSHFGLLVDYMDVSLDEGAPRLRDYTHIGALGRYTFRSDRDIVRPYVELGIAHREVSARTTGANPRLLEASKIGGTIGGGFQVFLARPVALDFGLQLGVGGFGDWEDNGAVVTSLPQLQQGMGAVRIGVRFWPGY